VDYTDTAEGDAIQSTVGRQDCLGGTSKLDVASWTPRHVAMSWARRLKRVFGIEIENCARCRGKLAIIASIEQPQLIAKILSHLEKTVPDRFQAELPLGARAPPQGCLLRVRGSRYSG
jgi:hypothetical protein